MATQVASASYSEPSYASDKTVRPKHPFYVPEISKYLVPSTRQLLSDYSSIPEGDQIKHVHAIRDKAWAIRGYPCTGLGVFLVPSISRLNAYSQIVKRLKQGEAFLDVGCFLGYDMRQLVFDGAPSANMVGVDIVSHWDVGFELFRDEQKFNARFVEADFLDESSKELKGLESRVDVINVGAVLHQWNWVGQVACAERAVKFSKVGTLLVGYQIGCKDPGKEVEAMGTKLWRHGVESWKRMWSEVEERTGTDWAVSVVLKEWEDLGWDRADMDWLPPDAVPLLFELERKT